MDSIVDFIIENSKQFVSGIGILLLAILHKIRRDWKDKLNIQGEWQGMSVYIPLQNDHDHECIYKLRAKIKQTGPYISFEEDIFELLDNNLQTLSRPERKVRGKGKFHSDKDIIIKLQETKGLTCGVIYVVSDSWGKELSGYIVVTNPFDGKPVVVRLLLRKAEASPVVLKDLNFDDIKFIRTKFLI